MDIEDRLSFYSKNYDLIADGAYNRGPKKFISDGEVRLCRFCGKGESETLFVNVSHAIPECLGNHQLVLLDECDTCNKFFSENLEDHLDKFTKPYRVAGQIHGKRGIPNYRTPNKKNRIEFADQPTIKSQVGEDFVTVDHEKKEITISLHQEAHIPIAAYKALVKTAISIIEEKIELTAFRATIEWLLFPDQTKSVIKPAVLMHTFVPGPRPTNGVVVSLFRRKASIADVPYALFLIAFGNAVFQIIVPSPVDRNHSMSVQIPFFPSPFELMEWPYGTVRHASIDMSGTEKVAKNFPLIYSFDSLEEQVSPGPNPC